MRTPRDIVSTMYSQLALQLIASGDNIINSLVRSIGVSHVPVLGSIVNWAAGVVRSAWNNLISLIAPGASASNDYYAAGPEAITNIGNATAYALSVHSGWIHWTVQSFIPGQFDYAYNVIRNWVNGALNLTVTLYDDSLNFTIRETQAAEDYTTRVYNYLLALITNGLNSLSRYISDTVNALYQYIYQVYGIIERDLSNAVTFLRDYANQLHDDAVFRINAAVALLQGELAALLTYVTVVFVPGAIEANNVVMNELTAVEAAIFWERIATVSNANLVQLVLIDPTGVWDTDELPEIPPLTIPTAVGETISAFRLPMDFMAKAGIPLYRNLKKFGEDTAELDGLITTVVLGGLLAAAIAAPDATAGLIATTVAGPLNSVATELLTLLGSL